MNPVELSLFASRMEAVCEEMGSVLRRSAFSPNIKDRLDYSCAVFDAKGGLCAQAAHIPVHLGSMAFAMGSIVSRFDWQAGQVVILNDPFLGGTHLPDVTLIAPVFAEDDLGERVLIGFTVNRAHHANIGSDTPGSMPLSSCLDEEGVVISPQVMIDASGLNERCNPLLQQLGALDSAQNLSGDLAAQLSAVKLGVQRLGCLIGSLGNTKFLNGLASINAYASSLARKALSRIPPGEYFFSDVLDGDGLGTENIFLCVTLTVTSLSDDSETMVLADFSGSSAQVKGNVNCPISVTAAAVYYVFRCLMPEYSPACAGLFKPIKLQAEVGSVVNACYPAAVVAGNVETSSRLVDVVMGALAKALPDEMPAASQGTMNNVAMGKSGLDGWDYYETLAGGHGAGPNMAGGSAMHSHMTNTLNTPVESLELHYPMRINQYGLRRGSGGAGENSGGDGLVREYQFIADSSLSLSTERRVHRPWGAQGGEPGQVGINTLNGRLLPAKCTLNVKSGDILRISTPGGGGWGADSS